MICTKDQVAGLMSRDIDTLVRPLFRRNGQPIAYRRGQFVSIQRGRFAKHIFHMRILDMREATVGELRAQKGEWDLPSDWSDGMPVVVMRMSKPIACEAC